MKIMTCMKCVQHLTEDEVRKLGNSKSELEIKGQWFTDVDCIAKYLRIGEEPIFCCWSYMVMGSLSVCAEIEVDDE